MSIKSKIATRIKRTYLQATNTILKSCSKLNSTEYWNARFKFNWNTNKGRLQTNLFALAFVLIDYKFEADTIIDYGCGLGDSLPVLKSKFPQSELFFYDFSSIAMNKANEYYGKIAKPLQMRTDIQFDLVYCSNVIEHVSDLSSFCHKLINLSNKYIVIQAPYNERHLDGTIITEEHKIDEHIRTITEKSLDEFSDLINWEIFYSKVHYPHSYDQIFFVGIIKDKCYESNKN